MSNQCDANVLELGAEQYTKRNLAPRCSGWTAVLSKKDTLHRRNADVDYITHSVFHRNIPPFASSRVAR